MLARVSGSKELVDQLYNSSEKRLARTLLQRRATASDQVIRDVPPVSQETLAEMIGTTDQRRLLRRSSSVSGSSPTKQLKVNNSLLTVVLHGSFCFGRVGGRASDR